MNPLQRQINYLRISVTDRCNERCLYCMPEGYKGWQQTEDHLTADELLRVVRISADIGFRKFRLTGGEPLIRSDLVDIVSRMSLIPGVECMGLSTNGLRLASVAKSLREAGLRTVNISLDALDTTLYRQITGGDVNAVLEGIRAAIKSGYERIKLNCVLMRGINQNQIWPLVLFAAEHNLPLRLIELMPMGTGASVNPGLFLPIEEVMQTLAEREKLVPQPSPHLSWGPAKYYRLAQTGALVGFIGAMTQPHFCETCNKMRLTANGMLRPCLGDSAEVSLRSLLRENISDADFKKAIQDAVNLKPLQHSFGNQWTSCRPMTAIGG